MKSHVTYLIPEIYLIPYGHKSAKKVSEEVSEEVYDLVMHQDKEIRALQRENGTLKEALEFYAAFESWKSVQVGYGDRIMIKSDDVNYLSNENESTIELGGKRARQALEEIKSKGEE